MSPSLNGAYYRLKLPKKLPTWKKIQNHCCEKYKLSVDSSGESGEDKEKPKRDERRIPQEAACEKQPSAMPL